MQKVKDSIEIAAPAEEVFNFVADFNNALEWMHGFNKFEPVTKETRGLGATVRAAGRMSGIPVTTELQITEFQPHQKLVSVSRAGLKSMSAWMFEPVECGTKVSFVGYYEPPRGPLGKLADIIWLQNELQAHTKQSLRNLKRAVEAVHQRSKAASL